MAKSKLVNETIMYSVNKKGKGEVVVHRLPYPKDSVLLETYLKRGFLFERPAEPLEEPGAAVPAAGSGDSLLCGIAGCDFIARSKAGLVIHRSRMHR